MTMPNAVQKDRGQPAKVRIGVITASSTVMIQETEYQDVGFLGGYLPAAGDVVAVIGQSAVGTSGSSWLVLGRVESAGGLFGRGLVDMGYAIASADYFFQGATAGIPGLTHTFFLPAGTYVVCVQGFCDIRAAVVGPTALGECVIDGVTQAAQIVATHTAVGQRATYGNSWQASVTLTGYTSLTVSLSARRAGGADNQAVGQATHSTLNVQVFR